MNTVTNPANSRPKPSYTQIKVSVDPKIASTFKEMCAASNVSMASELSRFMADYTSCASKCRTAPDYSTRRRRRTAIRAIIKGLELMKACEDCVRDNMPDNLQGSTAFETAEEAVSLLDEAIEVLSTFWMLP